MSSTSSTQSVRRSKRLQDKKNSSPEQQIGTESGILQIQDTNVQETTQVTATVVIEQLPPDAALASTRTIQQTPCPKRGRKRKNSSPERPIESENHPIQDTNAQETTASIIEQLPSGAAIVNRCSTQTVRRSKRLRNQNQKNSSPEQQLGTEFETFQIQGTTARVTTTVIEQLLPDAAMASTSSAQQTPLPKRGRKRKISSPERSIGTESETQGTATRETTNTVIEQLFPEEAMDSASSTQTVRRSKRIRTQKNTSPEQQIGTEFETLHIQGTTASVTTVIEQLLPDAAMASTSSTQQTPLPKRGRKRKNSSPEQLVGTVSETLPIQETATQGTVTQETQETATREVRRSKRLRTQKNSSPEQPVGIESEILQIQEIATQDTTTQETATQETTTRATTSTIIEQLLPDAALTSTSFTQQISSPEQPVETESETLQIQETATQDTTTQETATQETTPRATTPTVIEQLPPDAAMTSTSFTQQISSSEQPVGTESVILQIQETATQVTTILEIATQETNTRIATPAQLPPNVAMASTSSTQQISSHEQPVGTEPEILQIQETTTQGTTVTQETATQETTTRVTATQDTVTRETQESAIQEATTHVTTLTVIEQLPPDVAIASTSTSTTRNEQPAEAGPSTTTGAANIRGATNENNNGEREARPAKKKKKKSKKSKKAEKRLARIKTRCSLRNRERMVRAEQQRIFLIQRNKVNDFREEFVIIGPTGNVYTVIIAHLPSCTCPDFKKGFMCKHIFFVYLKVLGVNRDSSLIYQKALLSKELRSIFTNARPDPTIMAVKRIRDKYKMFTSRGINENETAKRRPIEGNCPICYESLEERDRNKIVWCKQGCGNNLHKECFEQWKRSRYGSRVTCVYCRINWVEPEVYITDDGYINLGLFPPPRRPSILQGNNSRTMI